MGEWGWCANTIDINQLKSLLSAPVAGIMEQCDRWLRSAQRNVVADVDPQPAGIGLVHCENRDGRVVAAQSLGSKD